MTTLDLSPAQLTITCAQGDTLNSANFQMQFEDESGNPQNLDGYTIESAISRRPNSACIASLGLTQVSAGSNVAVPDLDTSSLSGAYHFFVSLSAGGNTRTYVMGTLTVQPKGCVNGN
jgi:hypothetical protein